MASSAYLLTLVQEKILLLSANYAPKGYEIGAQMSPGGRLDYNLDQDILCTAIREWEEEVGQKFPASREEVKLLGIFTQEDLSICIVFFVELNDLIFDDGKDIENEISSRKLYSFKEIQDLNLEKKIFRAQFQFISWFTMYRAGKIILPVISKVNPSQPPEFLL